MYIPIYMIAKIAFTITIYPFCCESLLICHRVNNALEFGYPEKSHSIRKLTVVGFLKVM